MDVPGGAEQDVLTHGSPPACGGSIVWSNDGTGLLYAIHSREIFPGMGGGPTVLHARELRSSQPRRHAAATNSELRLTNGCVFVPLSWDKAGALSTALVTGEGGMGRSYVTGIDAHSPRVSRP